MAKTCTKCGEALIGTGRFCASCGTAAPPPSAFGATMQSQTNEKPRETGSSPPAARPSTTSPVTPRPPSASNYGPPPSPMNPAPPQPGYAPPVNAPGPQMPVAGGYAPYAPQPVPPGFAPAPPAYANYAPPGTYAPPGASPPPPYGPAFVVGARVLVQWADGNRYPGIVQQIAAAHCLIGFPDGQLRWVEPQYLALAV
jgi:hypothetical protein